MSTPKPRKVYIAGPDLFHHDWPRRAAEAQRLCTEHGLCAVLPIPAEPPSGPGVTEPADAEAARKVFDFCRAAIIQSHGVIANLSPFRGTEPDSGTVVECAFAYSHGLPVIGYGAKAPPCRQSEDGRLWAEDGIWAEQFGLRANLMLHHCCVDIADDLEGAVIEMAQLLASAGA